MPFPQSFLDELIARNDIVDVVGSYVSLTPKGGSFWGCCPFHNEKTPSFHVLPDKQFYHCFGCKKGGGVINFVMDIENLSYPDAVRFLAKRAGLLHDIGKAMTQEVEGSHVQIGIDIARKYKENRDVIHAIEAHHNDVEPQTVVAMIIQAADAISAARPGARREDLENYLKRLQKLEEIANSFPGVDKSFAIQAGREIRVMVKPEVVNDDQMILTAREIVKKIESSLEYPGQIKINLIRESRAVDYAK